MRNSIRIMLLILLTAGLSLPVCLAHCGHCGPTEGKSVGQFKRLEGDIPTLYLINGLNLSKEQCGKLSALMDQVKRVDDYCGKRIEKATAKCDRDLQKEIDDIYDLAGELCPRRSKARDAFYGKKYVAGKPRQELSPSTWLLFSEPSCAVLEKMAKK